ncbi:hypothetical protein ACVWWG_000094 [Bradyrhizobium sp. LB7.2]
MLERAKGIEPSYAAWEAVHASARGTYTFFFAPEGRPKNRPAPVGGSRPATHFMIGRSNTSSGRHTGPVCPILTSVARGTSHHPNEGPNPHEETTSKLNKCKD